MIALLSSILVSLESTVNMKKKKNTREWISLFKKIFPRPILNTLDPSHIPTAEGVETQLF